MMDKYAEAGIEICFVPEGELYLFFCYLLSVDIYWSLLISIYTVVEGGYIYER